MKTDYEAMIVTYLDGRTSAAENRMLDERLRNDPDLRKRFVDIAPSRQRRHPVAILKLLNNGEGALPDRAGGTENGKSFQRSAKSNK